MTKMKEPAQTCTICDMEGDFQVLNGVDVCPFNFPLKSLFNKGDAYKNVLMVTQGAHGVCRGRLVQTEQEECCLPNTFTYLYFENYI